MIQIFNKTRKTRFYCTAFLVVLFGFPVKILAQEAQGIQANPLIPYTFETASGTYSALTGGTSVGTLQADDAVSGALPIGFTFTMGCKDYTNFWASSNGYVTLDKATSSTYKSATPGIFSASNAILAPLLTDLNGFGIGTFRYQTSGTAPNRVLTMDWQKWRWSAAATAAVISFQVKLYEGTNVVEYIYYQEPAAVNTTGGSAAIGIYNFTSANSAPIQSWLTGSGTNPGISKTLVSPIITKPANGQIYRFKYNGDCVYYGQTLINASGGALADGSDGIRINLSGTGNMQVRRKAVPQIYNNELTTGTSSPYTVPGNLVGSQHGLVLSIGTTSYAAGTLWPATMDQRLNIISSTKQSDIQNGNNYVDVIKMYTIKNGLTYLLEVTYTYVYPDTKFLIDYKVTIPAGNSENVRLAHGLTTNLQGALTGPGYVTGTAPNLIVGVNKSPYIESFKYVSGIPWSGYYSAYFNPLITELANSSPNPWMAFNNTIDPNPATQNGIGISMNFGSTPGAYTSSNMLLFVCPTGDTAPALSAPTAKLCTGAIVNLNSFVTSTTPEGAAVEWKNGSGVVVADPTNVTTAGTYTMSYVAAAFSCSSPTATLTVSSDPTCGICYKTGVTTGTAEPIKTIISKLDRTAVPRNMGDPRAGSLILESKTKGFVLTRIASPETAIAAPVEGMLVYDTVNKVLKLYNGTTWNTISQNCSDL